MPKINPTIQSDLTRLVDLVDQAGKLASSLIARGMDEAVIKKMARQKWNVSLYGVHAKLILQGILHIW